MSAMGSDINLHLLSHQLMKPHYKAETCTEKHITWASISQGNGAQQRPASVKRTSSTKTSYNESCLTGRLVRSTTEKQRRPIFLSHAGKFAPSCKQVHSSPFQVPFRRIVPKRGMKRRTRAQKGQQ
eukprot:1789367-Amphidinium_carterae.1